MGRKALEVGIASQAAALVFDRLRIERGLTRMEVRDAIGTISQPRFLGLINGKQVWTLEDVNAFTQYFNIPFKTIFREIEKEIHRLTTEKNYPYPFIEDSQVG